MKLVRNLKKSIEKLGRRREFFALCKRSCLHLDYNTNRDDIKILKDIFQKRCYARYFPFYQNANILDIGAHKGYFSLFAALHTSAGSNIVCMEPCESNYQILVSNLEANSVKNIAPIKAGLWVQSGTTEMFVSRSWNNSLFKQYPELLGDAETPLSVTINVYSLRDILNKYHFDYVDFMKLDCEGAEYPIIFEADGETLSHIRTISMEFHDTKEPKYTGLSMIEVLRKRGFSIVHFSYSPTNKNLNYGKIVATRL